MQFRAGVPVSGQLGRLGSACVSAASEKFLYRFRYGVRRYGLWFLGQTSYQKWKVNEPGVFYLLFYIQYSEKGNTEEKKRCWSCASRVDPDV